MRCRNVARYGALLAGVVVGISACGGTTSNTPTSSKEPVKIGLVVLSGPVGANEVHMLQGFNLAIKDINASGGIFAGRTIDLVQCEDQVNPTLSTECTRKLIDQDGLKVLFLDTASPDAMADQAITGKDGAVAVLASQRDTPLTEQGNQYLFRTGISGKVEVAKVEPQIVADLKPKTVGILTENNSFGLDEQQRFVSTFQKDGVNVVYQGTFAATQTDFTAELTKAKSANPDVLVMIGEANHGGLISRQAKQIGLTSKLVASSGMTSPDLLTLSQGAMEGQYAESTLPLPTAGTVKALYDEFQAQYNQAPSGIAAEAYTAMRVLAKAINSAGTSTDASKVRTAMTTTTFDSPIGQVHFDSTGQNINAVAQLWVVRNGSFTAAGS